MILNMFNEGLHCLPLKPKLLHKKMTDFDKMLALLNCLVLCDYRGRTLYVKIKFRSKLPEVVMDVAFFIILMNRLGKTVCFLLIMIYFLISKALYFGTC